MATGKSNHQLGKKGTTTLICSLVLIPSAIWFSWQGLMGIENRPISVTGTIQAKEIPLASKVGGRIAKVLVQEGQLVAPNQVLIEFELPELQARADELTASIAQSEAQLLELQHGPRPAEIDKAKAACEQAFANWQMLKHGYRKEDIAKAQAQRHEAERNLALLEQGYRHEEVERTRALMEQAKVEMDWAKQDWQRFVSLSEQGAVSKRDSDELKAKYSAAQKAFDASEKEYKRMTAGPRKDEIKAARERLNFAFDQEALMLHGPRSEEIEIAHQQYLQAKAALTLLQQGTRYEQIERAKAQLAQARASLKEVEAQLRETQLKAPAEAEVSVMDLHEGEVIAPNKALVTLTRLDTIWTRVYIPERELARVVVGQKVIVKVDAFPNRKFEGKVVQIPSVAEFTPRNVQTPEERSAQVFGLKVIIDNKDRVLRGGMNAEITLPPVETPWAKLARSFQ